MHGQDKPQRQSIRSVERLSGIWALLGPPAILAAVKRGIGAPAAQRELAGSYVRPGAGDRILDLGCGLGGILPHLPDGVEYIGLDLNPDYVDWARQRHGPRTVCADATKPGFADRFDLVLARGLLHHLNDVDAGDMLANAARYLAPGGRFVAMDPVRHAGQNPMARGLVGLDRGLHIRDAGAYRRLLAIAFDSIEEDIRTDLLRLPYSNIIHVATGPLVTKPAASGH